MRSAAELTSYLIERKTLVTAPIIEAFCKIDRADFVPDELRADAYRDVPLPIGHGQTISQPSTVAFMLELLDPHRGDAILDVGSGSGWTTALLAHIVGPQGSVRGLDVVPELAAFGVTNVAKYSLPNARIERVPEAQMGIPSARFDRILVSAAAERIPDALIAQIKPGGKMVAPEQDKVCLITKDENGSVARKEYHGFAFVPLRGA